MEIKTLEHFAVTEIEDLRARIRTLEAENARLESECKKVESDWREMWRREFDECARLLNLCEEQQTELERSIEQLAELESQFSQLADKYNALARRATDPYAKYFEPVRTEVQNDGD